MSDAGLFIMANTYPRVAATALVYDATLYSNNNRDFIYIRDKFGLNYINPITDQRDLQNYLNSLSGKREAFQILRLTPFTRKATQRTVVKIQSVVTNAKAFLRIQKEYGSFSNCS
jgi:hypothetical protein